MMNLIITKDLIDKLNSIATDLKVYINANAAYTKILPATESLETPMMTEEEIKDLLDIRHRLKDLRLRLNSKLLISE